ncbi:hypothetical protein G8O18_14110 [Enterobacter kobei]|uniref:hypothetical protein n=1 Tax=Enterobacter kobei TaxID=208224 RepID=UPI002F2D2848
MKLLHVEIDGEPQTLIFKNRAELKEFIRKARMVFNFNMNTYRAGELYKWTTYSPLEQARAKADARLARMQRKKHRRLTRAHRKYLRWKWKK